MDWQTLLVEKEGAVAYITLNRPEVFNALSTQVGSEVVDVLERLAEAREIRAVVLTGTGPAFSGGGDLQEIMLHSGENPATPFRHMTKILNRVIYEIRYLPKPVIAAINGVAAGAAITIMAACDYRVASSAARFKAAYPSAGLTPDGGWTALVPLLIGPGRAMEMLLFDQPLTAEQALAWGLVNEVVAAESFPARVKEIAQRLAAGPTRAYATCKALLNQSIYHLLERQAELERYGIMDAAKSADFREGLAAYMQKRAPLFRGE